MIKLYPKKTAILLALMLVAVQALAQVRVTGTVTSGDDGTRLPGVSILEKGTTNGTVTDANGNYSITVSDNAVLVFSFVGFASQEVALTGSTAVNVILQPDITALDEIVVVGYGMEEKSELTGSVVSIGARDFNRGVFSSPQDLLVGKVAGVQVTPGSGAPGSGAQILIRGGSSVNASNAPLIVVDGFPLDDAGISGMSNSLASINPNDIESMTVLKDAAATAIYGSRASNGVIIITTKKGAEGKPTLNYNGQFSISTPTKFIDVMTGDEYREYVTAVSESDNNHGINAAALAKLGNENTDWQDQVFRDAFSMDHNLSFGGTTSNIPFRVSYGYTDQQGILKTTEMKRHSLNLNVSPSFLNDDLTVNATVKWMHTNHNFGDEGAVGAAVSFDPTQPVYNGNTRYGGYFTWVADQTDVNSAPNAIAPRNPVAMLELKDNTSSVNRLIGNVELDYRFPFLPELRAHLVTGLDMSSSSGVNNTSHLAPWTSELGELVDYTGETESQLFDFYLAYDKQFNDHSIAATGGYSYQRFDRRGTVFSRSAVGDNYYQYEEDEDGNYVPFVNPPNPTVLLSFFGRLKYDYKDKYLLTAILRNDHSSRFDKDYRSGLFPAISAAWRIGQEDFMDGVSIISELKVRGGWGITGQQAVGGTYPYLPVVAVSTPTAQYQFGGDFYLTYRPNAYDASFKWEETVTKNVALDFGLLDNRITGSFEYYNRESKDLINTVPIPAGSNLNNFLLTNVGNLENVGYEITLNGEVIRKEDMGLRIGFNFSQNDNKITKLTATDDPNFQGNNVGGISGGVGNTIQNDNVGYPRNSFFVFQQIYDASGRPIEGLYVDRTGEGGSVVSNQLNKYRYHSPYADYIMGITAAFNYKNFDIFMAGRASIGNYVYNNGAANAFNASAFNPPTTSFNNLRRSIYDTNFGQAQYWSDFYVENGSFFKMDNISLGYNVNALADQGLKARVSFTVQNAFMVTKYSGLDPEVGGGIDNNLYPRPRVFLLGLNLTY